VLDRARVWTSALAGWCTEQPQLVTFTGHCLVQRVEILELAGAWHDASEEVRQIRERTVTGDPEVFGDASYREGELHRLRGDLSAAEESYRLATEKGCDAQPGLALLRLAQGQTENAVNAIRRVLATTTPRWKRAHFLPAAVEIFLGAGELEEARRACAELEEIARDHRTELLVAMASHARGALALVEGDGPTAATALREAFLVWNRAGAPYVAARIRVLLSRALESLGDRDGADLELGAARKVFAELGAVEAAGARPKPGSHGLSKRELEVLLLLASGKTNKVIGRDLYVSERTVDRHVSNIFAKIGVSTRAAATAFAYEKNLVGDANG
jgi:ATP/maltotriose-dependent transcriptional regulator MalT